MKHIITEFNQFAEIKHIAITIPKSIDWIEYNKELIAAENGDTLNFKVALTPTKITPNLSRCYVVYNGKLIGYHIISGISTTGFDCTTTGKHWDGIFIQRTGKFTKLENPIEFKGFRGFRYIDEIN